MGNVLIDRTTGTNIGNMTFGGGGGLAAAFDGTTSAAATSCAQSNGGTDAYIGKTLASRRRFAQAIVYGSNNHGFVQSANPSVTINIRGKQGSAPSSRTDGTIIGTATFTDTANESAGRTIDSTDLATGWDHIWADLSKTGSEDLIVAELVLYSIASFSQAVFIT